MLLVSIKVKSALLGWFSQQQDTLQQQHMPSSKSKVDVSGCGVNSVVHFSLPAAVFCVVVTTSRRARGAGSEVRG